MPTITDYIDAADITITPSGPEYRGVPLTSCTLKGGTATTHLDCPAWIDPEEITVDDVAKLRLGRGCDTGVYMPAVTYHQAKATMAKHGEALYDFLQVYEVGMSDADKHAATWGEFCAGVVSLAVEYWARGLEAHND